MSQLRSRFRQHLLGAIFIVSNFAPPTVASAEQLFPDALPVILADERFKNGSLRTFTCETTQVQDWRICLANDRSFCVVWSRPIASVGARSGRAVTFGRPDVVLMVVQHPTANKTPDLLFFPGFQFGSEPTFIIDGEQQLLALNPESKLPKVAFPKTNVANVDIIAALQLGGSVVAQSTTSRDVELVDTFSLAGFEDALLTIREVCPS